MTFTPKPGTVIRATRLLEDGTPSTDPTDTFQVGRIAGTLASPAVLTQERTFRTTFHLPGLDTPEGRPWRDIATGMPFFYDHTRALGTACKHCRGHIRRGGRDRTGDWVHSDGDQMGCHTCPVAPYGFHAEPVGTDCGDHPANPCNGARGLEVRDAG